ncbi:hypothetical protein BJV82DRAFT_665922 [Fennellomyces sp. T-0311]|nr:hypothetical protein BJV82DRAFT_665922 [Fennellomyces sp. T-0311]
MDFSQTLRHLLESRNGIRPSQQYIDKWIREQPPRTVRDRDSMHSSILEHFLNQDLKDTSLPTIPASYGNEPLGSFPPGNGIVLQIVDTHDISNSTHALLNNLATVAPVRQVYVRRAAEDDVQFPRGMLRWTLTDGFTEIIGLEYETISQLNLTTPFGCKLFIKPCEVRRGMMFLKPSNVKVLGGQVPSLFGGNMLAELERRFKARLGLQPIATPENETIPATSTIQPTPNATQPLPSPSIPQPQAAPPPTNIAQLQTRNTRGSDQFDGDDYWDMDMEALMELDAMNGEEALLMQQEQQLWEEQERILREEEHERQLEEREEQQWRTRRSASAVNDLDYAIQYPIDEHLTNMETMSVDNELSDTVLEEEGQDQWSLGLQSMEISAPTVAEVVQYMKDMKNDRISDIRLSEQVTIQGLCVSLVEFRIKSSGYKAFVEIKDSVIDLESEDASLYLLLPVNYVSECMGLTPMEYVDLKSKRGQEYAQKMYSKPFGRQFHNVQCEVQLDLSITEQYEKQGVLMPHVVSFRKFNS